MSNLKSFTNDILSIYEKSPSAIRIIFQYNLVKGPITRTDQNNNNILHLAAMKNDTETIREIVNYIQYINPMSKQILNQQNNQGNIAMHIATSKQNGTIAELLDKAGSDLSIENNEGEAIKSSEDNNSIWGDATHNAHIQQPKHAIRHIEISGKVTDSNATEDFFESLKRELNDDSRVSNNNPRVNPSMMGGAYSESSFNIGLDTINDNLNWNNNTFLTGGSKESDAIHAEVLQKCIEIMGDEDDGRALKKGLWEMIKEQNTDISGLEKSNKLKEIINDDDAIKQIKPRIGEIRKIIENSRKVLKMRKNNLKIKFLIL